MSPFPALIRFRLKRSLSDRLAPAFSEPNQFDEESHSMWNPPRCRYRLIGAALAWLFVVTLDGHVASAGTFEVESRRDIRMMKCKLRASHFLHRATFGPSIEDIDALAQRMSQIGTTRACREWIDHQME